MGGGAMGFVSSDALCLNSTKSWELAIAPISVAIPFNSQRTFGISFGMQLAWMKVHFKDDYAMFNEDGTITVRPIEYGEGETFKKSYVRYTALRFPCLSRIPVYNKPSRDIRHHRLLCRMEVERALAPQDRQQHHHTVKGHIHTPYRP
ncbi:MAG: hypothetical protein K2H16_03230 [Prevotella sp.]|nr:hypothetical protein [Prevotella sp.]